MGWLDITEELTANGAKNLKVGQVLIFDYEGSPVHLKVRRKFKGKIWAEKTYLYLPNEVEVTDKKEMDKL